jgi:hypothetical protein
MRPIALLVALSGFAAPSWSQEPAPEPAPAAETPAVDATKLGISLSNIKRGLRIEAARDDARDQSRSYGLRLEYQVQVFGQAPRIEVLKGMDLFNGPVPGSAPSHNEFLQFVTPQIYRTPGLPVSAFAGWAAQWLWQKSEKSRCEQEIANYRALIMQGVAVSAPRCT